MKNSIRKPLVGIMSTHPAPYRDPVFALLNSYEEFDIQVLFMFHHDIGHSYWGESNYNYNKIYIGRYWQLYKKSCFHSQILKVLGNGKYDVLVIHGYSHLTSIISLGYALFHNIPIVYNADTVTIYPSSVKNKFLKSALTNFILKRAKAIWVPNLASQKYMIKNGFPKNRIFQGSYCLDVDSLIKTVDAEREKKINLRKAQGINDIMTVFMMVGNMMSNRRHDILLEAFARLSSDFSVFLILIGDGPLSDKVEELRRKYKLSNVAIHKKVPFTDLKYYYATADVYVHTGSEPYSTALDYGAIAKLPIVTTNGVGAAYNYLELFETLPLSDPADVEGLLSNLRKLAASNAMVKKLGQQFRKKIKERNVQWAADQFRRAIKTALKEDKI